MKKVIVSGANGFIGQHLLQALLEQDIAVWALVRNKESLAHYVDSRLHVIEADFDAYAHLSELIAEREFDTFFHLAWSGTWGQAFQDYTAQMQSAAYACDAVREAARLQCRRFILVGTIVQLEAKNYLLSDEGTPRYSCIYGMAKNAASLLCRIEAEHQGIGWNTAILSSVYGDGDRSNMIENVLIRNFIGGTRPKLVEGNHHYDCTYVKDIVDGLLAIAEQGKADKHYYIGHRELRTFREIVCTIRDVLAPGMELRFGEYPDSTPIDYSLINLDALYRDTGFECRCDFRESILKTAEWVKSLDL